MQSDIILYKVEGENTTWWPSFWVQSCISLNMWVGSKTTTNATPPSGVCCSCKQFLPFQDNNQRYQSLGDEVGPESSINIYLLFSACLKIESFFFLQISMMTSWNTLTKAKSLSSPLPIPPVSRGGKKHLFSPLFLSSVSLSSFTFTSAKDYQFKSKVKNVRPFIYRVCIPTFLQGT